MGAGRGVSEEKASRLRKYAARAVLLVSLSGFAALSGCASWDGRKDAVQAPALSDESEGDMPQSVRQAHVIVPHDKRQTGEVRPGDDGYLDEIHAQPIIQVSQSNATLPDGAVQAVHLRQVRPVAVSGWKRHGPAGVGAFLARQGSIVGR